MDDGKWTLADSGLTQEQKEALVRAWKENQNETDTALTQLERLYGLNDVDILSKCWFDYNMKMVINHDIDIPLNGKFKWHNKCECGNYILHAEPIYPRRGSSIYHNVRCLYDTNVRYMMRIHNICYTCAKKRIGEEMSAMMSV